MINDARATDGYRLISRLNQYGSRLIDKDGNTVHEWTSQYPLASLAVLQEDGTLLRNCSTGKNFILAGGASGRIELQNWDGEIVWVYELNTDFQIPHHDVKRLANGNYLILTWDRMPRPQAIEAGVDPDVLGGRGILFERLIEVKPNYPSGGEIVWEWNLADHIIQDRFEDRPNYGELRSHPELVNVHYSSINTNPDWFHANSIDYNPHLDQIMISVRNYSEIWVIDHSTTTEEAATHTGGRYNKGGDLLYRWGNPGAWAAGEEADRRLGYQHNAHWIEPGLPGEGHIMIFSNNDPLRPTESQVVEIQSPADENGWYPLPEGGTYGPDTPVWSYAANEEGEFASPFISGMQRLPNGNTLICSGAQANVFEVSPEGEILWKFAERREEEPANVWLFRANWYPASFPGLVGTPLYQQPEPPAQSAAAKR